MSSASLRPATFQSSSSKNGTVMIVGPASKVWPSTCITRARPPGSFNFSRTCTRQPLAHRRTAAASPPKPLPITRATGAGGFTSPISRIGRSAGIRASGDNLLFFCISFCDRACRLFANPTYCDAKPSHPPIRCPMPLARHPPSAVRSTARSKSSGGSLCQRSLRHLPRSR